MVRHYRTDPVPSDIVQRIVRVVRRAPSAGFSQGHRVVVVTEPDLRQRIADLGESWYLERGYEPWLSQAPVHLILGIREASYHERYQEPDKLEGQAAEISGPYLSGGSTPAPSACCFSWLPSMKGLGPECPHGIRALHLGEMAHQSEQGKRRRRHGPGDHLGGVEAGALGLERVAVEG